MNNHSNNSERPCLPAISLPAGQVSSPLSTNVLRAECAHRLFEEQAARTPDAIAIESPQENLSFAELNRRANQLAHELLRRGVKVDALVAFCLPRSPDVIVALLGILKAGGAYLPLDPAYPRERIAAMIKQAQPPIIITTRPCAGLFSATAAQILCTDELSHAIARHPSSNPATNVGLAHLAYAVFTSGSTGQPKGILVEHGALINYTLAIIEAYGISSADRRLQLVSIGSDVLIAELFPYLATGGTIVVQPNLNPALIAEFIDCLETHRITIIGAPSALWHEWVLLMQEHNTSLPSSLRAVISGMDSARPDLLALWVKIVGAKCRWFNAYGPSEATCTTTIYEANLQSPERLSKVPIGRPIPGAVVRLLDEALQPVPTGAPGEIFIGGANLARGYLNAPAVNAEKFIADPFDPNPNARLYRTGDRALYRDDGNLEFLGRIDRQIKLRGHRIELGEIEAVLNQHAAIRNCAVVMNQATSGMQKLLAYVVLAGEMPLNVHELRSHMRNQLPHYMLPSTYVQLNALPLSPNGKIDYRALPPPDQASEFFDHESLPAGTATERRLAEIWRELLQGEEVGIDVPFFESGGDSFLAVRMIVRIEREFGLKLPLAALFQQGTIRKLASLLESSAALPENDSILTLRSCEQGQRLYFVPSLGGELFFARHVCAHLLPGIAAFGIQPANVPPHLPFEAMVQTHVQALKQFQPQGPYALIGYSIGGFLAYEMACQLMALGDEIDFLAILDIGPTRRSGSQPSRDWPKRVGRILANAPRWLNTEYRRFNFDEFRGRIFRNLRRFLRLLVSRGSANLEMNDYVDVNQVACYHPEQMRAMFDSFRNYHPCRYAGRLTLFLAQTRPLLDGSPPDLGWQQLAADVAIREVPGDHESILHAPNVCELSVQISEFLLQLHRNIDRDERDRANCVPSYLV